MLTSGIDGGLRQSLRFVPNQAISLGSYPQHMLYQVYSDIFQLNLHNISYNSDTLSIDFNKIYSFLDLRPKVFFLPNPNQPIEDTLSLQQIENIAQYCLSTNTLLVVDKLITFSELILLFLLFVLSRTLLLLEHSLRRLVFPVFD